MSTMTTTDLEGKLREIHTLLTEAMLARHGHQVDKETDNLIEDAEEKLNDLENRLAVTPLSQATIQKSGSVEEKKISKSLQGQFNEWTGVERRLYVAFGFGYYKQISSALIEVEGSPTRGMALIRGCGPIAGQSADGCEVWVLQRGYKMKRLQRGCKEAASLLQFAQSRLPARPCVDLEQENSQLKAELEEVRKNEEVLASGAQMFVSLVDGKVDEVERIANGIFEETGRDLSR